MLMSGKSGSMFPAAANATTGQLAYEPVRRWTRVEPVAVALDDAEGCAARALHPCRCDVLLGGACVRPSTPRRGGRGVAREGRTTGRARSVVARAAIDVAAVRLGTTGANPSYASLGLSSHVTASPAARAAGPVAPSRRASFARTTPMSGSRSSKERLKTSSRQAGCRCAAQCPSSSCAAETALASSTMSLPPTRMAPNRNRCPVTRALSRRARSVRPRTSARRLQGLFRRRRPRCRSGGSTPARARAGSCGRGRARRKPQAHRFLDGLRICHAVRDGACRARSRDVPGAVARTCSPSAARSRPRCL